MSKKEKEKTHAKKAEDNNFECHVSDIDLPFNTSFIVLHHLAFRLSTVRTSHIFFRWIRPVVMWNVTTWLI